MPPSEPLLPCPFCQGHGNMLRSEIVKRLEDPDLPEKIIAELNRSEEALLVATGGKETAGPGEFSNQVHRWNRDVLWRRSSKE